MTVRRSGIVTLLTDFGTSDAYVACMKGVILGIHPRARIVDLSHEVPPQDVRKASLLLAAAAPFFPAGTVHVAVVDPGVGTERLPIVVEAAGRLFVGPDNGIFGPASRGLKPRASRIAKGTLFEVSATFHGRDVFAPAAARLARGASPASLGPRVGAIVDDALPSPRRRGRRIEGEVAFVDRFGNLVTNVPVAMIAAPERSRVTVGRRTLRGLRRTYGEVRRGALLALVDSTGHLEVAVREGSAARRLGAGAGTAVRVDEEAG